MLRQPWALLMAVLLTPGTGGIGIGFASPFSAATRSCRNTHQNRLSLCERSAVFTEFKERIPSFAKRNSIRTSTNGSWSKPGDQSSRLPGQRESPQEEARDADERAEKLKEQIQDLLYQSQRMTESGDVVQALILRKKAEALFRSLREMEPQNPKGTVPSDPPTRTSPPSPPPATADDDAPRRPTLTRAEAVLTLNDAIRVLKLLHRPEAARPVERILNRIASPSQIQEILEYYRNPDGTPKTTNESDHRHRPEADSADANSPPPHRVSRPDSNAESDPSWRASLESETQAIKKAMDTLLDNDQADLARDLAKTILLRNQALKDNQPDWTYPDRQLAARELKAVQIGGALLYRDGKTIQARVLADLATQLAKRMRNTSPGTVELPKAIDQSELISKLLKRIEELEAENRKLKPDGS